MLTLHFRKHWEAKNLRLSGVCLSKKKQKNGRMTAPIPPAARDRSIKEAATVYNYAQR